MWGECTGSSSVSFPLQLVYIDFPRQHFCFTDKDNDDKYQQYLLLLSLSVKTIILTRIVQRCCEFRLLPFTIGIHRFPESGRLFYGQR